MSETRKQLFNQFQMQDRDFQNAKTDLEILRNHWYLARSLSEKLESDYKKAHANLETLRILSTELIEKINEFDKRSVKELKN